MKIDILAQDGEIYLAKMTALVARKSSIKQIQFKHSISRSDVVEIVGWMDGPTLDKDIHCPVALVIVNEKPYLVKASMSYYGREFIDEIMATQQIFLQ